MTILVVYGLILTGIGLHFIFIRPTFLPEDARFVGASLEEIMVIAPNISQWLNRVFTVLGGYIISTGILTLYVALTLFKNRVVGSVLIIFVTGMTSIGLMVVINLIINSDFRWSLVALAALWSMSIILYMRGK